MPGQLSNLKASDTEIAQRWCLRDPITETFKDMLDKLSSGMSWYIIHPVRAEGWIR